MALNIYKTFTREKLTYQNLNALQQHFADYINNYVLLAADCVSANTPNKVVKRDASGNFAAGTITANLVGNVTGNLTGNANTNYLVTTYINGHAITDILEPDGVTAKKATHAASADSASSCTGNSATATEADNSIKLGGLQARYYALIAWPFHVISNNGTGPIKIHGVLINKDSGALTGISQEITVGSSYSVPADSWLIYTIEHLFSI